MSATPHGREYADDLHRFARDLDEWIGTDPPALVAACRPVPVFADRVAVMCDLMAALSDAGWARWGWPEAAGGLGGSILHRAAMWEALARRGVPSMALFEHLEVLGPSFVELAPPDLVSRIMPEFLAGRELWCQGFSEPGAGSDLAALRTRATETDGGYLINGRKIWTSWAPYASWCLLLARTGTPESRHRGVTAFVVDMRSDGVDPRALIQANGTDELAEVSFDDVFVPADRIVGELNGGWAVAMHILSSERGTFAWFRHLFLYHFLHEHLDHASPETDLALGNAVLDLAATSATSYEGLVSHSGGAPLGPRATFTKLLLCNAEQSVADWVLSCDADLAVGVQDPATSMRRQEYLFSRIVTVYGGSQQMQLETISKQILKLP